VSVGRRADIETVDSAVGDELEGGAVQPGTRRRLLRSLASIAAKIGDRRDLDFRKRLQSGVMAMLGDATEAN
jgi:hypothetical protein